MSINKQSSVYTVVYITLLVAVVGIALSWTYMTLHGRQQANADADKMKQILASLHVTPEKGEAVAPLFERCITGSAVVTAAGDTVAGADAFTVDVAAQAKEPAESRLLPVYKAKTADGAVKYILPVSGNGLWGPIWGYVAVDADGTTIYGAYFAHQGETPGLGAEIEKPAFSDQFDGKHLFKEGVFKPVAVVKKGQSAPGGEDTVDGISGGTITSKGVGAMIDNCISPYQAFLGRVAEMQ
ncbi:MAG: NADH:ubiquinone reductase (Na(+)-transporting) subunit C [Candidatus Amulumruptor caecigallinarius]|nr:NADH:ubiquinone reductase (Na(+)-transporting) subunit C [Candidatus Amulumruptor caecigallinarius]MCM1397680.1 NADH:ubiquinone reductase (Na(+)-transporting) subunit C [Candidatus Amulumruptor caecigallinarius]MCM1454691.1 NADH:ubiquinone reductase (Na(+)-transporting) subunit C [bacterium]